MLDLLLKERVFGIAAEEFTENKIPEFREPVEKAAESNINLEEILETLEIGRHLVVYEQEKLRKDDLDKTEFWTEKVDDEPQLLLYEMENGFHYVFEKKEEVKYRENNNITTYVPTGVIIRRVPQTTLGTGVLGRAFLYQGYIEILDSLVGNDYMEVLTHELLHLQFPDYPEKKIRWMTRNCMPNARYN